MKICTDKMYELALELYSKSNEWNAIVSEISGNIDDNGALADCGSMISDYADVLMRICENYNENEKNIIRSIGGIV